VIWGRSLGVSKQRGMRARKVREIRGWGMLRSEHSRW